MKTQKLVAWFVDSAFDRHNDAYYKFKINNTEDLRKALVETDARIRRAKGSSYCSDILRGIRMYLGEYEIGGIELASSDAKEFHIAPTDDGNNKGFAAILFEVFQKYSCLSEEQMDNFIKNGVTLENFLETLIGQSATSVIITDDHKISTVLLQSSYQLLSSLYDAIHDDFKYKYTGDERLVFVKRSIVDMDKNIVAEEEKQEEAIHSAGLPRITEEPAVPWFVPNWIPYSERDEEAECEFGSAQELVDKIKELEEKKKSSTLSDFPSKHAPYIRMYCGDYQIGGIRWDEKKREFSIDETGWSPDFSIGCALSRLYCEKLTITFEQMDNLLNRDFTIEEFVKVTMTKYAAFVSEDSEQIFNLLHQGYRPLTPLNYLLHPADLAKVEYRKDGRILFIYMPLHKIFE